MANGMPGLYIDADMSEGIRAGELVSTYLTQMSTPAHLRTVISTTHTVFADIFNQEISVAARMNPDDYHHVYEYSPTGDGYREIGKNSSKLWVHTIQHRGGNANFSWNWLPAKRYNPTYSQRRMSSVGFDAIRELDKKDFERLMERTDNRRHKFVWKAPMLEHGLPRRVNARGSKFLMLPVTGKSKAMFAKSAIVNTQQPGDVKGNFTLLWTNFWANRVPKMWDEVIGQKIEEDAARRIGHAITRGAAKPRSRSRTFSATAITNVAEAKAAGKQQALTAIRSHRKSIKGIEGVRGTFHE